MITRPTSCRPTLAPGSLGPAVLPNAPSMAQQQPFCAFQIPNAGAPFVLPNQAQTLRPMARPNPDPAPSASPESFGFMADLEGNDDHVGCRPLFHCSAVAGPRPTMPTTYTSSSSSQPVRAPAPISMPPPPPSSNIQLRPSIILPHHTTNDHIPPFPGAAHSALGQPTPSSQKLVLLAVPQEWVSNSSNNGLSAAQVAEGLAQAQRMLNSAQQKQRQRRTRHPGNDDDEDDILSITQSGLEEQLAHLMMDDEEGEENPTNGCLNSAMMSETRFPPCDENGRCAHRKCWKRLRAKRGATYFVCLQCGLRWRTPGADKSSGGKQQQQQTQPHQLSLPQAPSQPSNEDPKDPSS